MTNSDKRRRQSFCRACFGLLLATVSVTGLGCQMDIGGQTLPSPYYMTDDPQYFPAGPEFILSREAAAMKALESYASLEAR